VKAEGRHLSQKKQTALIPQGCGYLACTTVQALMAIVHSGQTTSLRTTNATAEGRNGVRGRIPNTLSRGNKPLVCSGFLVERPRRLRLVAQQRSTKRPPTVADPAKTQPVLGAQSPPLHLQHDFCASFAAHPSSRFPLPGITAKNRITSMETTVYRQIETLASITP